jgi:hypothetical protein
VAIPGNVLAELGDACNPSALEDECVSRSKPSFFAFQYPRGRLSTSTKGLRFSDARSLEFRVEAFNAFNHAQFYGPASVDGQIEDPSFGHIDSAAAPRLMQLAVKYAF